MSNVELFQSVREPCDVQAIKAQIATILNPSGRFVDKYAFEEIHKVLRPFDIKIKEYEGPTGAFISNLDSLCYWKRTIIGYEFTYDYELIDRDTYRIIPHKAVLEVVLLNNTLTVTYREKENII